MRLEYSFFVRAVNKAFCGFELPGRLVGHDEQFTHESDGFGLHHVEVCFYDVDVFALVCGDDGLLEFVEFEHDFHVCRDVVEFLEGASVEFRFTGEVVH